MPGGGPAKAPSGKGGIGIEYSIEIAPFDTADGAQADRLLELLRVYFPEVGCDGLSGDAYQEILSVMKGEADAGSPLLLCRVNGAVAGFAEGQIDAPGLHWCERPGWGCVCEFFVLPAFRRAGVGRRLCDALLAALRQRAPELPGFYLTADPKALEFWQRCGFMRTGEICEKNGDELMEIRLAGREEPPFRPEGQS